MEQDLIKLGMVGSGHWSTDLGGQRPTNYREKILELSPNGDTPLTGMLSKLPSESTNDVRYNWFSESTPKQGGAITNIWTNAALASAYSTTSGQAVDTSAFVQVSELVAEEFRVGHSALLTSTDFSYMDTMVKVTSVLKNGANSYIGIRLLEADDNGSANTKTITSCDYIYVAGNINPEGGGTPDGIIYEPSEFYNLTQNFRTPFVMSGDALETKLRTGDARQRYRRRQLLLHGLEQEFAFFFGIRTSNTGSNNQLERTTMGITTFIRTYASTNEVDYRLSSTYQGQKWRDKGVDFLDDIGEAGFKFGSEDKVAFTGSGALKGISQAIRDMGDYNISQQTVAYGLNVRTLTAPQGTLHLLIHPLFNHRTIGYYNSLVIIDPRNLVYRYMQNRDTRLVKLKNNPDDPDTLGIDGIIEEYRTSCGLELHHADTFHLYHGIGLDNVAA